MKNIISSIIVVLLCVSNNLFAGNVITDREFKSDILKKNIKYAVYLPDGYDQSSKEYPVLYLLHGLGDNYKAWIERGNIKNIVDSLSSKKMIEDMVIIMPDAWDSWYVNDHLGECNYEDMFFKELMPYIESTYKISKEKKATFISGLSMGGNGSLVYSFRHPDRFGVCGALSPAVLTDEDMGKTFNSLFKRIFGDDLDKNYKPYSVIGMATRMPQENKDKVAIYIDCGDDDFLYRGNDALHTALRDAKIPHEYRVRDGGHDWEYWKTGIPEVLKLCTKVYNK